MTGRFANASWLAEDGPDGPDTADAAFAAVQPFLRCPVCTGAVHRVHDRVTCERGHRIPWSRPGRSDRATLPVPVMFGRGGRLDVTAGRQLGALVAQLLLTEDAPALGGPVVDVASGRHLSAVLEQLPFRPAIAIGPGPRTHPRVVSIPPGPAGAALPVADGAAAVVLHLLTAPPVGEALRVLSPRGVLVVASPTTAHLAELVRPLAVLGVTPRRPAWPLAELGALRRGVTRVLTLRRTLDRAAVAALLDVEPAAVPALTPRLVTHSIRVSTYRVRS